MSILITGCSATGPKYSELEATDLREKSEIIIFRESKLGAAGSSFCVTINNKPIGILKNGGFLRASVEPGNNLISMPLNNDKLELDIKSRIANSTFVEFTIGLADMLVLPIGTITSINMSWDMSLRVTPEEYGLTKLNKIHESDYINVCDE